MHYYELALLKDENNAGSEAMPAGAQYHAHGTGCFAFAVLAHHADPFPGVDGDAKVVDQLLAGRVSEI